MNNKAFTLTELIIVVAILSIIGALIVGNINRDDRLSEGKPKKAMHRHINFLRPDLTDVRVMCVNEDSDQNGYVRCTATGVDSNMKRDMIIAECNDSGCAPIDGVDR